MKNPILAIVGIIFGAHVAGYSALIAAENINSEFLTKTHVNKLVYKPPTEHAPTVRIDGGARNVDSVRPSLYVLAPQHVGYTIKEKPTLFWYQSQPLNAQFELVVAGEGQTKPILRISHNSAEKTGIQCIRLAEHNVKLARGIKYRWSVSLILDPDDRSKDIFSSGMVERIDPPETVLKRLMTWKKKDLVYVLAEEGVWYDALDAVSSLIESNPDDPELRDLRAELLNQGNLPMVAKYARTPGAP